MLYAASPKRQEKLCGLLSACGAGGSDRTGHFLKMPAMVTCLDDGARLALDDMGSMYTYDVFAKNPKTEFAEPNNRDNVDTFDLEGIHIGVSGSSMEWIR